MDIIGEEDFFGDMDFKVCGTKTGITGVQLDLKARGLWFDELETIFEMARKGRYDIIDQMERVLPGPREEMSEWAPRMLTVPIDPEKIGNLNKAMENDDQLPVNEVDIKYWPNWNKK